MARRSNPPAEKTSGGDEQPFLSHLVELRTRVLRCLVTVLIVLLGLLPFANKLYTLLAQPLLIHLPAGSSMIATEVASPFLIPFKLTLMLAVFASVPMILYQIWAFVAPGLYHHERRLVLPLVVSSTLLFYLGMVFAYFVVFPLVFGFFTNAAPEGVSVMTDISKYLDFVLKLFFAFGVAFEVPIATILLVWADITTAEDLASKRPYVIVVAFVIGMLLTPPDVISQSLLAVPMWLLFELGLLLSRKLPNLRGAKPQPADDLAGRSGEMDEADRDQIEAVDLPHRHPHQDPVPGEQTTVRTAEALTEELDNLSDRETAEEKGTEAFPAQATPTPFEER